MPSQADDLYNRGKMEGILLAGMIGEPRSNIMAYLDGMLQGLSNRGISPYYFFEAIHYLREKGSGSRESYYKEEASRRSAEKQQYKEEIYKRQRAYQGNPFESSSNQRESTFTAEMMAEMIRKMEEQMRHAGGASNSGFNQQRKYPPPPPPPNASFSVSNALLTLGITDKINPTRDEVKKAYHAKVKFYHPDVNPNGSAELLRVNAAWDFLKKTYNWS